MEGGVVGDAEMPEQEPGGAAPRSRRSSAPRPRRRCPAEARRAPRSGRDPHAGGIAGEARAVWREEGDVVGRVPRRRERVQVEHAAADDAHVLLRNGREPPHRRSKSSPYSLRALRSRRLGSTRCGAPISLTCTSRRGFSRTSDPAAPAWSRWMCVSTRWCSSPTSKLCSASRAGGRPGSSPGRSRRAPAHHLPAGTSR